jgi:uncharacterized protein (DUF433 family)
MPKSATVTMPARQRTLRSIDLREVPMYNISEVGHHLGLPRATLRAWVFGRTYRAGGESRLSPNIIDRPDPSDDRLSFTNLIEAHVVRALRVKYEVPMPEVRKALRYAEEELGIPRILMSDKLHAAPGEMFLKEYGRLLSLTVSGQVAIEEMLRQYLARVSHDVDGIPFRLYPFIAPDIEDHRIVSIDPRIAYGRPSLPSRGISTAILAERANAGEDINDLAAYYGLKVEDVKEAVIYEGARAEPVIYEGSRAA